MTEQEHQAVTEPGDAAEITSETEGLEVVAHGEEFEEEGSCSKEFCIIN
jgi:hypothetical protein